jgi:F-type H+-transporting ATPase subunit epsilon
MAEKLTFELVSPQRLLLSQEVDEVVAPGVEGEFGVLEGHAPLLTALNVGELVYKVNGQNEYATVERGFLEVNNNKVIVLAEDAELGREIDLEEAIRRKLEAEKALERARKEDEQTIIACEAKLKKELLRLGVAEKYKNK